MGTPLGKNTSGVLRERKPLGSRLGKNTTRFSSPSRFCSLSERELFMQVTKETITTSFERFLAILEAVLCLGVTIALWLSLSAYQNMWPLPGLYFIEMVTLSIISTFLFVRSDPRDKFITWVAAGVISAFSILGALSVGFFYLPVALIYTIISVTSDVRNKQKLRHTWVSS